MKFAFCNVQLLLYHTSKKISRKNFQKDLILFGKAGIITIENTTTKRVSVFRDTDSLENIWKLR